MLIFSKAVLTALAKNGAASAVSERDHKPVVKIFNPTGGATWLLTESDPQNPDRLFGLCDLGLGEPELGYVSRAELESIRVRFGLRLERDIHFTANKTLSEYANEATKAGRIIA